MLNKKGVSPLIATVLIIGFTIVLAAVVMQWGGGFVRQLTEEQAQKSEAQTTCIELNFEITSVDTTTNTVSLLNNNDKTISKFLIQEIDGTTGNSNTLTGTATLGPYESEGVVLTLPAGVTLESGDKIRVIPYVKLEGGEEVGCGADMSKTYTI